MPVPKRVTVQQFGQTDTGRQAALMVYMCSALQGSVVVDAVAIRVNDILSTRPVVLLH